MSRYPLLEIHTHRLQENATVMQDTLASQGIVLSGVVKGANGLIGVVKSFIDGGIQSIASSHINQLKQIKEAFPSIHTLSVRIPMPSEVEEMVRYADASLNSEMTTIKLLNQAAQKYDKQHEIILMADLGDLREGYFDIDELIGSAVYIERECPHLILKGVGTNLGCYGAIQADTENLGQLVEIAGKIEMAIQRKLDWVSGGASSSLPLVLNQTLPEGINHLRVGNNILLKDTEQYNNYQFDAIRNDAFILKAEVIEVKDKPSHPIGTITVDAFGKQPTYVDRGIRKRAILAIGRQEAGDMMKLMPMVDGVEIVGGSSDHTIVDITDCKQAIEVGDTLSFEVEYENLLYLTQSPDVDKKYL